jgi:hypothetical protein
MAHIANIGPRGRKMRLRAGVIGLGAAVALAGLLIALGAPRGWRLSVFVPFWVGALGVFQARDKT